MEEAKWYVVHTFSGYENKVKVDIEKTVENRNLQDQILEVAIPLQEVMENKDGQKKSSMRKIFPAYVLVHMIMNDDTWYKVCSRSSLPPMRLSRDLPMVSISSKRCFWA